MANAPQKRIVGLALFASSGLTMLIALLIGTGVIPLEESIRTVLVSVLVGVAIVDALIGWRFLMKSGA